MMGCVVGASEDEANEKAKARGANNSAELRKHGIAAGDAAQIAEFLKDYEAVGCQRVMLPWLELDNQEGLAALAEGLLPHYS